MHNIIYNIVVGPIELIIESAYDFLTSAVRHNPGFAILGISALVNICCLPLYAKAEFVQEQERNINRKMAKRIASIKKHFAGDERHMILAMYYRENRYHPLMAMRSSLSLLIQIPFFIAAYSFISNFESFRGQSFFILKDLGSPDGLFKIGDLSVNALPILMTFINIVSGALYTRGFPLKEKAQLYAMAFVFLVLLYTSPAALVLYWTFNNIFSLIKNIVVKFKNPKRIFYFGILIALGMACFYVFFLRSQGKSKAFIFKTLTFAMSLLIAAVPLYIRLVNYAGKRFFGNLKKQPGNVRSLFIFSIISLWILAALVIPFNVVASDPMEFSFLTSNPSPFAVLIAPISLAFGLFVFWPGCLFFFASEKIKVIFSFLFSFLVISGIGNAFLFFGNYGMLSQTLTFASGSNFAGTSMLRYGAVIASLVIAALLLALYKNGRIRLLSGLMGIFLLSGSAVSIWKVREIQKVYAEQKGIVIAEKNKMADTSLLSENIKPTFSLSKAGKNVVVIMLDRAVGSYFPMIFEEQKTLKDSFSGFVYYPNTISFFRATTLGAPPLFGGYEYTPERLHEKKDKLMSEKNDEAMLVLPTLFKENNYSSSVFDMPNIHYQNTMDTSFFTANGVHAASLIGAFTDRFLAELGDNAPPNPVKIDVLLRRNFVMFSIFTMALPVLREIIYENGTYWSDSKMERPEIIRPGALSNYAVLYYLPQLTAISDNEQDNLICMVNNLTHSPSFFQYPDYTVVAEITDFGQDHFNGHKNSFQHYHANAAVYLLLAKWFDYLKEEGVYDNTRIVIASDHDEQVIKPAFSESLNKINTNYNPILLFKDFNAQGELATDMAFMTNADVPLLAVKDLIQDAKNPFTGKPLVADKDGGVNIFLGGTSQTRDYPGWEALDKVSRFYHVKDNIFIEENWTKFTKNYD
jgi:YidC/Oxa1 family membrane protein insertase